MLRIFSAAVVLTVVAVGCGAASQPPRAAVGGVPRALAQHWERQALAVATAASADDSCRALQLATTLRADVAASKERVPSRLRAPLLSGVNALANRIACTPPATPKPPKPPQKPHGDHGHHGHHGKGEGDGGGNEQ